MPLSPAERRRLVEQPFPAVRRFTSSYPWSGTLIDRTPSDQNELRKRIEDGESINTFSIEDLITFGD